MLVAILLLVVFSLLFTLINFLLLATVAGQLGRLSDKDERGSYVKTRR